MRVALVYGHSDWLFDKRISIATSPLSESACGSPSKAIGPGQCLTRTEHFVRTGDR